VQPRDVEQPHGAHRRIVAAVVHREADGGRRPLDALLDLLVDPRPRRLWGVDPEVQEPLADLALVDPSPVGRGEVAPERAQRDAIAHDQELRGIRGHEAILAYWTSIVPTMLGWISQK
jgi:hypothetical protein